MEETWVDGTTEKLSSMPTATSALELDVSIEIMSTLLSKKKLLTFDFENIAKNDFLACTRNFPIEFFLIVLDHCAPPSKYKLQNRKKTQNIF